MQAETPASRLKKLRDQYSRKLHETTVRLGELLLQSCGIVLPANKVDRERIAQIAAYKHDIRCTTGALKDWTRLRDRAAGRGLLKQARFRQQMIVGMQNKLASYEEELRRLRSIPGSFWTGST